MILLPTNFTLGQFRFTLKALEPLELPPFKGSALRGGFGYTFKRLVCTYPQRCDKACVMGNECPYGYVFETSPPADTEVLSTHEAVPRPFIIQSPADKRTRIPVGGQLYFGLVLVGYSLNFLPHFIAMFRELGQQGIGRSRGRYQLVSVEAVNTLWPTAELVYQAGDEGILLPDTLLTSEMIKVYVTALPTAQLTLNLITPTRLKHQGKWVRHGPSFEVLVKTLLGRVSSLSYFHCGTRFETDFRALVDQATQVEIAYSETRWKDWSRFSKRQQQRVDLGGLVGQVTYTGELRDYLPLLVLGQFIHVGKGNVFGNGQYQIRL